MNTTMNKNTPVEVPPDIMINRNYKYCPGLVRLLRDKYEPSLYIKVVGPEERIVDWEYVVAVLFGFEESFGHKIGLEIKKYMDSKETPSNLEPLTIVFMEGLKTGGVT